LAGDAMGRDVRELEERVMSAFRSAYPQVPGEQLDHMARNFTQIVSGIINIGERIGERTEYSQMDIANGLVYACFANTYLEELHSGQHDPALAGPSGSRISDEEMKRLLSECVARVADWLLGMEILREDPELFSKFVIGAVMLGARDWERNRGNLSY